MALRVSPESPWPPSVIPRCPCSHAGPLTPSPATRVEPHSSDFRCSWNENPGTPARPLGSGGLALHPQLRQPFEALHPRSARTPTIRGRTGPPCTSPSPQASVALLHIQPCGRSGMCRRGLPGPQESPSIQRLRTCDSALPSHPCPRCAGQLPILPVVTWATAPRVSSVPEVQLAIRFLSCSRGPHGPQHSWSEVRLRSRAETPSPMS